LFKEITSQPNPLIVPLLEPQLDAHGEVDPSDTETKQIVRLIKTVASMIEDVEGSDVREKLVNKFKELGIEGVRMCRRPFFYNSKKHIHVDEIPITEISQDVRELLNDLLELNKTVAPCSLEFSDELEHRRYESEDLFSNKPGSRPYKRGGKKTKKNKKRGKKSVRK
jgi:PII-like signaling protein